MTKIWRGVRRRILTAIIAVVAIGICTAAFAQNSRSVTILGTAHDFSTGAGIGGYEVPAGDNHCEVCHGPPAMGGPAWVEWRHASRPLNDNGTPADPGDDFSDYDGADWLYAIGDGTDRPDPAFPSLPGPPNGFSPMVAGWMVEDCLGCHDGSIAIDDYAGGPAVPSVFMAGSEVLTEFLNKHHPVDITYDTILAAAQGSLEDPDTFLNPQGGGTIAETLLHFDFASGTNKLWCKSCHEQHNDRRFDLAGGDPSDDPEKGATSQQHKFLKFDRLCFLCHKHDQPHDHVQHHIPGREDPFGDLRGSDISCDLCHKVNAADPSGYRACENCHNDITRGTPRDANTRTPGTVTDIPTGHHGGDRERPYFDCEGCHADPLTGIITGNDFGTLFAPSCYSCHDDLWNDGGNTAPAGLSVAEAVMVDLDDDPATPDVPVVYGTINEAVSLTAVVATNTEGDPLAFQWSFGDGTLAQFPSHDPATAHTYDDYQYRGQPTYQASVSVTDGVNPPIYFEFSVIIGQAASEHAEDTWTVTPSATPEFDVTFENHSGALVATRDDGGALAFGVEFVGVIFWMELWMDLDGDAFWGTGDMYFGNVSRGDPGSMSGVLFKTDGSVETFTGSGGAPPEH